MANTLGISTSVGNTFSDTGIYYDKRWLERLVPQLYFEDLGTKRPLPKMAGTLMKFRRLNKLTAISSPLTENTNPSETTVGTAEVTVEPLTYGQFVKTSKEFQWKSINPIMDEISDELSDNAALSYDTIVRAALSGNFTNQFAGGAVSEITVADTSVLNASEIRKAIYSLRKNNVPGFQGNMYKALIHPAGHFDLQSDTAAGSWLETSKYIKNDEILRGEVGALYGTRFVVSTNAGSGTGATDETFHAYVFGRDAYGISELSGQGMEMIRKEPGAQDTSNPLNMFSTIGWKFVMAAKVLQTVRAVQIYHGSAAE